MAVESAIQRTNPRAIDVDDPRDGRHAWTYRPQVDIFETPDELLLVADVPGADPEHIDVSMEAGVLTLDADVAPRSHDGSGVVLQEYGVGSFHRRFKIDEAIDAEAISAEYRQGSLTVRVPKAPQARRRRIPVST